MDNALDLTPRSYGAYVWNPATGRHEPRPVTRGSNPEPVDSPAIGRDAAYDASVDADADASPEDSGLAYCREHDVFACWFAHRTAPPSRELPFGGAYVGAAVKAYRDWVNVPEDRDDSRERNALYHLIDTLTVPEFREYARITLEIDAKRDTMYR